MAHKPSVSWKEGHYGELGALTPDQQAYLAKRFELSADQVLKLSQELGKALDPAWRARSLRDAKGGIDKGAAELQEVLKALPRIIKSLKKVESRFSRWGFVPKELDDRTRSIVTKALDAGYSIELSDLNEALVKYEKAGGNPYVKDHVEARYSYDEKRPIICQVLFKFYSENVGTLTVTNDPIAAKRSGKLFDFVRDVSKLITEPSEELKDGTAYYELGLYLKRRSGDPTH